MTQNVRRKPTRASLSAHNKRKDRERTQKRVDRQEAGMTWNELHQQYGQCKAILQLSTKPLVAACRNKTLTQHLTKKEQSTVARTLRQLKDDVKLFDTKLETIYDLHRDKTGEEKDVALILESFPIGSKYVEWVEDFNSVVTATVAETLQYMNICAERNASQPLTTTGETA